MLEAALGGQGRQGGKDDGAILDEPAAATALMLAYGQYTGSSTDLDGSSSSKGAVDGSGFIKAFCTAEQQALESQEAAVAAAAASAAAADSGAAAAATPAAAAPAAAAAAARAAGSFSTEWRWRRRSSPLAVVDRLRRMLLWRSAQAASRAGPAAAAVVTPAEAASGSVTTPVGCVKLAHLPQSYVALFVELLGLSMMPNAGVRGSALPTLQSCMKRFPCLVELLLPEVLAALAGLPGPLSSSSSGGDQGGPGQQQQQQGGAAAMEVDAAPQQQQQQQQQQQRAVVSLPDAAAVEKFYQQSLFDAMQSATPAAAAAGPASGTGAAASAAAAAAAAVKQAMATAAAAAGSSGGNQQQAAAAAAAAAAVAAAKAAAADAGGSSTAAGAGSVAKESENDGRVAGACAVLASSLDATRVVFRDPVVFEGFVYALMASRAHSSNACLKNLQMVIMQVGYHLFFMPAVGLDKCYCCWAAMLRCIMVTFTRTRASSLDRHVGGRRHDTGMHR
jgi:hypothetical protein